MTRSPERPGRLRAAAAVGVVAGVAGAATGCGDGALAPVGREASRIAGLWWFMFALAAAIFVGVLALFAVAVRSAPRDPERFGGTRLIVAGGIVLPAAVIVVLLVLTVWTGAELRRDGAEGALRIDVTGHQYWWDVRYPDHDVRTANEIHVPVGAEVLLTLRSEDVIHSVWVPRVAGKLDLVPGRENRMTIRVDAAGVFAGACAEFCGLQHARMRIEIVAHEPEDFERWVRRNSRAHTTPTDPALFQGWQVFMGSACVYCHRIDGTPADSDFGPDLTNLAERRTLAAGILDNDREQLAAWITDPQAAKPGNHMPATTYPPEQLEALLDYLATLEHP